MCGIVGYAGREEALPFLVSGLKRLEYRGYDSAGVALLSGGSVSLAKTAGRMKDLEALLEKETVQGQIGIGHTRWATHGRPNDQNAHPHLGCDGSVAVAHNGIIENFHELKDELVKRGHVFRSETDTEVIAHLLEEHKDHDLGSAVAAVAKRLRGTYAFAVIRSGDPETVAATRKDSPLVVGLGDGENYFASDIPALLQKTRKALILEDGDVVVLTPDRVTITHEGLPVTRDPFIFPWSVEEAERGGHPHFMIKEISEQPQALRNTLTGRVSDNLTTITTGLDLSVLPKKVFLVGCGTSYHAGLVGKSLIERLARIPTEAVLASEFRYQDPIMGPGDLVVVISQSGETLDTMGALRTVKGKGPQVLAITNVVGSSIYRESDLNLPTLAGPEISVASSKAYTTQIVALTLLALHLAKMAGRLTPDEEKTWVDELWSLSEKADLILQREDEIKVLAERIATARDVFFVGRGLDYAVAMEGQLKLKEISYIHAEALAAGELKHGTLALIEPGVPVIALVTQPELRDKTRSNLMEIKARGGWVFGVVTEDCEVGPEMDEVFKIPSVLGGAAPALAVLPLQLLAYHAARILGTDIDKPRNLAKSVTVE